MAGDFERELTRRVWTDDAFAARVESNPAEALKGDGPGGAVRRQGEGGGAAPGHDLLHHPACPGGPHSEPATTSLNQMDLWSSKGLFIWLVPVAAKFKLLALRNAARKEED